MLPIQFCKIVQLCIVYTIETIAQRLIFESSGDLEDATTSVSSKIFSPIIPLEEQTFKKC